MKKAYVEPDMKVILLNLNENIAASSTVDYYGTNWKYSVDAEDMVVGTLSKADFDSLTNKKSRSLTPEELDENMRSYFESQIGLSSNCRYYG